jgi:hypothetical protein
MRRLLLSSLLLLVLACCQRDELPPTALDLVAPLPPAGLVVESAHDGFIFIGWLKNTEFDFHQYEILRSEQEAGPFITIDTSRNNYFIDTHRSYDSVYYYRVCAIDRSGNRSTPSSIVSAKSPNLDAPDQVKEFDAAGQNLDGRVSMQLSWTPSDSYDLKHYAVYRSRSPTIDPRTTPVLRFTPSTLFADTTANEVGREYYYAVSAVDMGDKTSSLSVVASDLTTEAPVLLLPLANAALTQYPIFRWKGVPGAQGYQVSVSSSSIMGEIWSTALGEQGLAEYSVSYGGAPLVTARAYYWKVSTYTKRSGAPNAVSSARLFQVY